MQRLVEVKSKTLKNLQGKRSDHNHLVAFQIGQLTCIDHIYCANHHGWMAGGLTGDRLPVCGINNDGDNGDDKP